MGFTAVIAVLGKQEQKNCNEFEANQDYRVRLCLKTKQPLLSIH